MGTRNIRCISNFRVSAFSDLHHKNKKLSSNEWADRPPDRDKTGRRYRQNPRMSSGKSRALLPPSPLRTVHESFPSYGSSNSIFLFVVRNRLILSTFSFISLVAVVVDKLPYNRTTNRYFVDVPCFCTIYFLAT